MSGSDRHSRRVASVEDADDSDNPIEGTGRYAESVAPSPAKERSNTGRTRREKPRRDSTSPLASGLTDSDSTVHPQGRSARDSREYSPERKRALARNKQTDVNMRPAPRHANTTPHLGAYMREDVAAFYGVPATVTPASSRPRGGPQRPASYYGPPPPRPPPPNPGSFYPRHPGPQGYPGHSGHPGPLPPPLPGSYPAQSWAANGQVVYTGPPHMHPQPPPQEYYPPRSQHLSARFGSARPRSAMGHRPSRDSTAYDDYEPEDQRPVPSRRPSRKTRIEEDRRVMPPPPRPQTTRPTAALPFRPPPPSTPRKSLARFEDDDLDGSPGLFQDISPLQPYDHYSSPVPVPRTRRPSFGAPSGSYDAGSYRTEVAGRRNSYLGRQSVSSGSDFEDKIRQAVQYQDDISGPPVPLTAETLRKASKHRPASSRSTRSSGSLDESDFRHSTTTQTTRSTNLNENDLTIRVKGNASVKVGGAEVRCEGSAETEINISSNGNGGYRGGSDKSSYIDLDDRRFVEDRRIDDSRRLEDRRNSRVERPAARTRTSSQSGSFSRAPSRYQTSTPGPRFERPPPPQHYDECEYQIPPPYPAYPSNPNRY